jgi:Kae1-associated kinase Bud32
MELLYEGAEAQILKVNDTTLKKIRLPKKYRIEILDKRLRKSRNRREFKVLSKLLEKNTNVPKPYELIDNKDDEISFTFEYLKGDVLKKVLTKNLLEKAFNQIIKMHKLEIIHGDLTTLNMIEKNKEIYLIDFGLSEFSHKYEDRAVDLHLFFNCIKNEHPDLYSQKEKLEQEYINKCEFGQKVIDRLNKIELRGRNK